MNFTVPRRTIATVLIISLGLLVASSNPAFATVQRTLPTGDHLYAIPCNDQPGDPILKLVDVSDSSWTSIGTSHAFGDSGCAYQPAYNPVTKKSYFLAGNTESGIWPLVEVDTATGEMNAINNIRNASGNINIMDNSFPGNLLVTREGVAYFIGANRLYPLNLATGRIGSRIGSSTWGVVGGSVYAAACSPIADSCYVITDQGAIYPLNVNNGTVGPTLGSTGHPGNYSMQVDSAGIIWASVENASVTTFVPSDPAGTLILGSQLPRYSGAFLLTTDVNTFVAPPVTQSPNLANTGSNWLGLTAIALGLSGLGVALFRSRPTARRANKK